MKQFFTQNIDSRGRFLRAALAVVLLLAGLLSAALPWWARAIFFVSAGFVLFEAARGWCLLRACGIKTKF
jgi:hypothetical protein